MAGTPGKGKSGFAAAAQAMRAQGHNMEEQQIHETLDRWHELAGIIKG
jgi:hypothetical protein